jgi:hypothetical protein
MADVANKFRKTLLDAFTSMINASTAICAGTQRLPISLATPTGGIHWSINNPRMQRKKCFAERQREAAQWRPSETMGNKTTRSLSRPNDGKERGGQRRRR